MALCVRTILLAVLLAGCGVRGFIYSDTTAPLDLNMRDTGTQPILGQSGWKTFDYVVRVDWNSAAIAEAAREAGIEEIHFADMRVVSVLLGVWSKRTAIVYGR